MRQTGSMLTSPHPSDLSAGPRLWRSRRRVSQLELALRAGTTQRHVSFIESGHSVPGREMLIRLAESLQVPLRERNALLLSGGYAPAYDETPYDGPGLGTIRTALTGILEGHRPYPAVVVDRRGDLVLANGAFHAMTTGVSERLVTPPVTIPRLLLDPAGLAPRIVNFGPWAWHVIDALTREAAQNPTPESDGLIEELIALVPPRPEPPGH